jgi:AMMECR1 domain-containing protein
VNERRKSVGIPNTIEEQTELIRINARHDNLTPPKDFMKRKQKMEEWKKGRLGLIINF